MYNRFMSFLVLPSFYLFTFVIFFSFNASGMVSKEFSKERKEWLLKTAKQTPSLIQTMNKDLKRQAIEMSKALESNKSTILYAVDLDNSVIAATHLASKFGTMAEDTQPTFKHAWKSKKEKLKYSNKKQFVRAHWETGNLPNDVTEKEFWNHPEMNAQELLDCSLRKLGKDPCRDAETIKKQQEKQVAVERSLRQLKQATLVWKREDNKADDSKQVQLLSKDAKEKMSREEQLVYQQFADSFIKVLQRYNLALTNAAFYHKKENSEGVLHSLYYAQAIKNALFSIPDVHQVKVRNSDMYKHIKDPALADDLFKIHSFLADEKHQSIVSNPLPTREWIVFGCTLAQEILKDSSTIKSLLKKDSLSLLLRTEAMQRYVADTKINTFLNQSAKCIDFFDNHAFLKTMITPFGRYLIRPTLTGILSFTKNRLESKKEENKCTTPLLQNILDGFAIALKEEYKTQQARDNTIKKSSSDYFSLMLDQATLKNHKNIPLSQKQAKILKEQSENSLREIDEALLAVEFYKEQSKNNQRNEHLKKYTTVIEHNKSDNDYSLELQLLREEKKAIVEDLQRAKFWLRYYNKGVVVADVNNDNNEDQIIFNNAAYEHYINKQKDLEEAELAFLKLEQGRKEPPRWGRIRPDNIAQKESLKKECEILSKEVAQERLKFERANTPEIALVPGKESETIIIHSFIRANLEEYYSLFNAHREYLKGLEITPLQFLDIFIKAKLNESSEEIRSYIASCQDQWVNLLSQQYRIEDEQEDLKKERAKLPEGLKARRPISSFFSYVYSLLKDKFLQWRFNKVRDTKNNIDRDLDFIRKETKEFKSREEYKAFEQMHSSGVHKPYVSDLVLARKTQLFAKEIDPVFRFALSPEDRSQKESSLNGFIAKRVHRSPKFALLEPLPSYARIEHKKVTRQEGAQCALYALLNGIGFCENEADFAEKNIDVCRLLVKKMRLAAQIKLDVCESSAGSNDDEYELHEIMLQIKNNDDRLKEFNCDWLEPVESQRLKRLLSDQLNLQFNNIIFITDTSWYLNGSATIKLDEARKVQELQNALRSPEDCKFGIHLNTFRSSNGKVDDGGHYIALLIEKKDNIISYKIANSYDEISPKDIFENFMKLLWHYDFKNIVSKDSENKIGDILTRLGFRKVFIDKKLNQDLNKPIENVMENDRDVSTLINWILKGAKKLLFYTDGKALWANDGFNDTKAIMLDALDAIEQAHKQSITVYPAGKQKLLMLTEKQKELIKVLRCCIETAKN